MVATSTNAQHVSVQLAGQTTPLTQQTSTTWSGSVAYDPQHFSLGGEQVYLTTTNASGTQDVETIAVAAPLATQEQVFAFQSPSQNVKKIFGLISVESFRDSVGRFYLYFMVFLFGMLVLNMLVRLDKQKHVVNLHVFGVILLAAVLSIL